MDVDTPDLPPQEPDSHRSDNTGSDNLVHAPRRVIGDRGAAWLVDGWDAFKAAPGQWIGLCVVGFIILCILNLIPGVNMLNTLLQPVWIAGVMMACHAQRNGEAIRVSHLFAAFGPKAGRLIFSSVIIGVCGLVIAAITFGSMAAEIVSAEDPNQIVQNDPTGFVLRVLIFLALALPLYAAYWFAPALIIFSDMSATAALKQSFAGCMKNLWPFTIYSLCLMVLGIVVFMTIGIASLLGSIGSILAGLAMVVGILVIVPVSYSSIYLSFRDIFVD